MAAHSWESPVPPPSLHPWEVPGYAQNLAANESDEDPDPMEDPVAAAGAFLDVLVGLYLESVISAKTFCILCFWASKGSLAGEQVRAYAMKPGASTGNYQKHLDSVLGFADQKVKVYNMKVPCAPTGTLDRGTMTLPVRPPYELVDEEAASDPSLLLRLQEAKDAGHLPACYTSHPVVVSSEEPVLPYSIFMDGLPYSNSDSVVGIWLVSMLTGWRGFIGMIRKRVLCSCGCRGRCTFFEIMSWLRWAIAAMCAGIYPAARHDGSPFTGQEPFRASKAGHRMKFKSIVQFFKGDWVEFAERFGFPSHASTLRPCFCCSACTRMYDPRGVSVVGAHWHGNTEEDFEEAMRSCEIRVALTPALHDAIRRVLVYDRRPQGSHGRALSRNIVGTELEAGDRLEPSESLRDVSCFEQINVFPTWVTFWRPSRSTLVLFRSPLWDRGLGITPVSAPALDLLHTLYLGPMQQMCLHLIWATLDNNIWGRGAPSEHEGKLVCLTVLKNALDD
eukprot:10694071-Lingulodinium_polyedra.AAC.1